MVENIINDIKDKLNGLKLKISKEWFDSENVPDSIIDNSYIIAPIVLSPGDLSGAQNRTGFKSRIINLSYSLKIFYSKKIPANNLLQLTIDNGKSVEDIIKSILSIGVGSDEKDSINFVGSVPSVIGNVLVNEIDFSINYRINN